MLAAHIAGDNDAEAGQLLPGLVEGPLPALAPLSRPGRTVPPLRMRRSGRTVRPMEVFPATTTGPAGAPRVVLLHGFTQTSVSWAPVAEVLAEDHQVVAVDLPGHGRSGGSELDLPETAAAVGRTGGPAAYVGYSMGGRVALRLALDHPELVRHLILVGATAGIDDPLARAERRAEDEARAQHLDRAGTQVFLDEWLAQPLFAQMTPRPDDLAARRANPARGLAASLRRSGTGTMDPPWWAELASLGDAGVPVTVVVGERDHKFAALGQRLIEGIGPTAHAVTITGAGHACHLEDPGAFLAEVRRALTRPGPTSAT